jgi:hypothetical protein
VNACLGLLKGLHGVNLRNVSVLMVEVRLLNKLKGIKMEDFRILVAIFTLYYFFVPARDAY